MLKKKKLKLIEKKMSDAEVKNKETEFMRQKRSDPDIKQKESKSSKAKKHNTIIYGKKLKRIKKKCKKNKTKSNRYTEKENIKKGQIFTILYIKTKKLLKIHYKMK